MGTVEGRIGAACATDSVIRPSGNLRILPTTTTAAANCTYATITGVCTIICTGTTASTTSTMTSITASKAGWDFSI